MTKTAKKKTLTRTATWPYAKADARKPKAARGKALPKPAVKAKTPKVIVKVEKLLGMPAKKSTAKLIVEDEAKEQAASKRRGKMTPPPRPSAKAEAEAPAKNEEKDAPRIETRLVVGDVSVPVDAASLDHTLGSGPWGHTQGYGPGLVDTWPDTAWAALLAHLRLPAFPLDREAAEKPVKRLVQKLWYEAVQGGVPEERRAVFAERDAEAAKSYKPDFEKVEATAETRAKAGARMQAARGGPTTYEPTPHLKKNGAEAKGQAAMLFSAFKAGGFAPMTTVAAAEAMVKAGLVTTTKPERIAAFYLCQWVKTGWLARKEAEHAKAEN